MKEWISFYDPGTQRHVGVEVDKQRGGKVDGPLRIATTAPPDSADWARQALDACDVVDRYEAGRRAKVGRPRKVASGAAH